jgi:hypothetical protein
MAGFKMHISTSTVLGVAYGSVAWGYFGLPIPSCLLATGLCSVSGMLPDLDSDSGVPLRESVAFAACVVPMMLVDRLQRYGLNSEMIVIVGAGIYLSIRFGFARLLAMYTVHRGMFHSLPAAMISAEIAFLLSSGPLALRSFKAVAVLVGFMSHLVLDEIYSLDLRHARIKSSFGTAMKIYGDNQWTNFTTFAKLVLLTLLVLNDPVWINSTPRADEVHGIASGFIHRVWR